jgi:hypothetical protein
MKPTVSNGKKKTYSAKQVAKAGRANSRESRMKARKLDDGLRREASQKRYQAAALAAGKGNPKPYQAQTEAAKKKNASSRAAAVAASRGNPKPMPSQVDKARGMAATVSAAKAAAAAKDMLASRGNPKPLGREVSAAAKKRNAARKASRVVASGPNTKKPSGERYRRTAP